MKKLNRIIALAIVALSLLTLVACNNTDSSDKPIEGLLAIQPEYVGDPVMDTTHEFKKSDFEVTAIFTNNVSKKITDFDFEVGGMSDGVYVINFKYGGQENDLYVKCEMDFFSDGN